VFRTFVAYKEIAEVRKETRSGKGATAVVLVIYKSNSASRITIPISNFDRTKIGHLLDALRCMAPQARVDIDKY
jgi:hypothetical protein